MKFGSREICNVVFKAKAKQKIGNQIFQKGQPVLYIDSAKTSTMEGAATTVYATGGRGNVNLIAWEGEKTLTFTVEDALLSPISFSMLSGAGLIKGQTEAEISHVHASSLAEIDDGVIDLKDAFGATAQICKEAPIFVQKAESDGSVTGELVDLTSVEGTKLTLKDSTLTGTVMVDCYLAKKASKISELQIDAANFAGYYYVEADTLFRKQIDGQDMPANITFPNVKIQSNFTFAMAASGDPSTFTFTMDAFPGYTYFDQTKQVLCVIQIIEESDASDVDLKSVMEHKDSEKIYATSETQEKYSDSYDETVNGGNETVVSPEITITTATANGTIVSVNGTYKGEVGNINVTIGSDSGTATKSNGSWSVEISSSEITGTVTATPDNGTAVTKSLD